tara:strand:+ start:50 stop:232 length:183 start_codon:yes stop_codon:yes gene_type:complete
MARGYGIRYTDGVSSLNLNKGLFRSTIPTSKRSLKKQNIKLNASARQPSYGRISLKTISV